jgi:acyl-CoA synthetase (AMP-forming)/AMP-acid ligase II
MVARRVQSQAAFQAESDAHLSANVAARLAAMAQAMPEATAVVEPLGYDRLGKRQYRTVTFRELDGDGSRIARGLCRMGVTPGTRLALLVRPGIDYVALVFALLRAGAVVILIDPGMGRKNLLRCLADAEPEGFVAIPVVQAVRALLGRRFPKSRFHVTVGRRWFWGGATLAGLRSGCELSDTPAIAPALQSLIPNPIPHPSWQPPALHADDPAAIIFTTGSTGPPKGVLYTHGNFDAQVQQIRDFYGIQPGEIDLPGFPLFGLFNCAMGVTAVIPDMDPTRPALVDPNKIIEAVRDWKVTQAFGSPAIWNRVGRHCEAHAVRLPTIRRILSAGAPVPADVLQRMTACIHPEGDMHTPYGATEALPVASISAREVLGETVHATRQGAGVCVGRKFSKIQWKVLGIVDGPIARLDDAVELPCGEIGELIVHGPVVTRRYATRPESNALGKIADGSRVWHRMGDAGYLDSQERFWFCGRVAHRVLTADGPLYTIPCEAIFNQHPDIFRSALVGLGPPGRQRPVILLEPQRGKLPPTAEARQTLLAEIERLGTSNSQTASIRDFLFHPSFPVDIRHNAKIFREKLAPWAAAQLAKQ